MPSRRYQVLILLMWGCSTSWFVHQELWPHLGQAANTYRSMTRQRAVDETTRWRIASGTQTIGSASTRVQPVANGSCRIHGILSFDKLPLGSMNLSQSESDLTDSQGVHVELELTVDPQGRLVELHCVVSLFGSNLRIACQGRVVEDRIEFHLQGLDDIPAIPRRFDYPFDSNTAYWENFTPRDRFSGLELGQVWSTRVANPLAKLPGPLRWLMRGAKESVVTHEVTAIEDLSLAGYLSPP